MDIQLLNEHPQRKVKTGTLKSRIASILEDLGLEQAELSLVLTDDEAITRLNRDYLERDKTTNTISFPQQEGEFGEVAPNLLGDVVVNLDAAAREAELAEKSFDWALIRLVIHGILHLAGYDHESPGADAAAMEAKSDHLMGLVAAKL